MAGSLISAQELVSAYEAPFGLEGICVLIISFSSIGIWATEIGKRLRIQYSKDYYPTLTSIAEMYPLAEVRNSRWRYHC